MYNEYMRVFMECICEINGRWMRKIYMENGDI